MASDIWVLTCFFKLAVLTKAFAQNKEGNGFSPVWVLSCTFKVTFHKMLCHTWNMEMASLLCGTFYVPLDQFFLALYPQFQVVKWSSST